MGSDRLKDLEKQLTATASGLDGIDALNMLAKELCDQDPERARILAERALELAYEQQALGRPYIRGTAQALSTLGDLAINSDAFGLALTRLFEAYALLQGQMFTELLAETAHSIGWAHFRLGNYDEALDYIKQALNLYRSFENIEKEATVLTSIGSVYNNLGEPQQAMLNFQQALHLQINRPISRALGVTLNNLAYAQVGLHEYDDAINNARTAIDIFQELNLTPSEASALDTLGLALLSKGEMAQAEECLKKCVQTARHIPSAHLEMEAMLKIGKIYIQQRQFDQARDHYIQAIELAQAHHSSQYRYKYHEQLAKIEEEQGHLALSLHHLKEYHTAMEQSLAEAASHRLNNLKILHKVEKNQKEAEVLWLHNRALEREIDERRRERIELEKLATTDPLTGLYNRRHFFTLGEYEFGKAKLEANPLSVIILDIDHFKLVNDQYGHAVGDQALISIARLFTQNARKGDICCRYGGEEFVILMPATPLSYGQEAAERIRLAVFSSPLKIGRHEIALTVSLGIAQAGDADSNFEAVVARSDQALYRAKAIGRNRISL